MEFKWKGVRAHLDENSQGALKVMKMASEAAAGKPVNTASWIHAFLDSPMLLEPEPAAALHVAEDEDGELVTETAELYLVVTRMTLEEFFRALNTAVGIPQAMLSWLMDVSQLYVKLCETLSGDMEMYGFGRDQAGRKRLSEMYADEAHKAELRLGFSHVSAMMEMAKGFLDARPDDFFVEPPSVPLAAEPSSVGDETLKSWPRDTRYWWDVDELPAHLINEAVRKAFSQSGEKSPQLPKATYTLDLMRESDVTLEPLEQLAGYTLAVDKSWQPISMQCELNLSLQLSLDQFFGHVQTTPGLSKNAKRAITVAKNWAKKIYENHDIGFVHYVLITETDLARFPMPPDTPDLREVYRLTLLASVHMMRANVTRHREKTRSR